MGVLLSSFMRDNGSAIASSRTPILASGPLWGLLGVLAFSFTVPFTRVAVGGGALSPLLVGAGRAVIAAALAAAALIWTRQRLPQGPQWWRLVVVAGGVVVGFPLLTSFALTRTEAAHGAVVIALLPAATAVAAVLRVGERPPRTFWVASIVGAVVAVGFAVVQGGGLGGVGAPDLLLCGAVVAAAVGYAEGGLLARELGAWQTVSWALVVISPVMTVLAASAWVAAPPQAGPVEWAAFGYLAVVSMWLGFFAWYRGLAIGPMARVSQVQLTQPVMTIAWAALFLHERVTALTVVGGIAVILCAALAVRSRQAAPGGSGRRDVVPDVGEPAGGGGVAGHPPVASR